MSQTPIEVITAGHALRRKIPRLEHAAFDAGRRKQPALTLIEHSMRGRVPDLIRLKYRLMTASPFAYFRGTASVMAADLAALPNSGIECQICGDAHVRNLGGYAAPDGPLVFDINDFDETVRAPFEWDIKRMAVSLVLAGREAGDKKTTTHDAVGVCIQAYAKWINLFAVLPHIEVARFQVHSIDLVKPVHAALLKAERATPRHSLAQLTEPVSPKNGAPRRFKTLKPLLTRVEGAQRAEVLKALMPYMMNLEPQRQRLLGLYRPMDVAFKVVGTGSVGLRDYCVYLEGNGPADPLFLQIKEEADSAYAPYLRSASPQHNGQRVVEGQRAMQMQTDPFLGWTEIGGRQYLVRQLNDHKGSIDIETLSGKNLAAYGEVCGELLARGHARSGNPLMIAGYVGTGGALAKAITKFAAAYADQTEKDWQDLKRSGKGGKV